MRSALTLSCFLGLIGCDARVGPDYQGEPLERLRGQIQSSLSEAPAEAEIVLLWVNWQTAPGTVVGTRSRVAGTFPAGFTMNLYAPPPPEALNETLASEPRVGFAWIMVLEPNEMVPARTVLTHTDVKTAAAEFILGWSEDYVVAWVDGPVAPGMWAYDALGQTGAPGYRLLRAPGRTTADLERVRMCKESDTCPPDIVPLETPAESFDFVVPVRLSDRLDALRVPVFEMPERLEAGFWRAEPPP